MKDAFWFILLIVLCLTVGMVAGAALWEIIVSDSELRIRFETPEPRQEIQDITLRGGGYEQRSKG